jgi:hypothetical protein
MTGCEASNPVKGWTGHDARLEPPNQQNGKSYHIDQAIIDDYQAYAHKVWPKDRDFFISEVYFYEDGTGRHAVMIELEPKLRENKIYYLMYDTNNVRTKVVKGGTWHQFHM